MRTEGKIEKSLAKGWNSSDVNPMSPLFGSASSTPIPDRTGSFERGIKYKSDGMGICMMLLVHNE